MYGKSYSDRDKRVSLEKLVGQKIGKGRIIRNSILEIKEKQSLPHHEYSRRRHNYSSYSSKVK